MDPAKPTTSKKHAEITKIYQEKIKRKEKLILLLKELLHVRDENFKSKCQQHLAPALLNWQENFEALKKELLVAATSTHSIVQEKEEHRRSREKAEENLRNREAVIAHLEFQAKQLNCALHDFRIKERSWNEQQKQEKKSGISFTIGGRKKKLKEPTIDDLPPTPESSISGTSRCTRGSESPLRGSLLPSTSTSSSANPTLPWLESLAKQKTSSANDSDSDDSDLETVEIVGRTAPKRTAVIPQDKVRSRSVSSSSSDDDADLSSYRPAETDRPSPDSKLEAIEADSRMIVGDPVAASAAVTTGLSIFDYDDRPVGNDCKENETKASIVGMDSVLALTTDELVASSTDNPNPSVQPTSPAVMMDISSPAIAEEQAIPGPNINHDEKSVFKQTDSSSVERSGSPLESAEKQLENLFSLFDDARKDLSGLSDELDLSHDDSFPISLPIASVYKSDSDEELDCNYDNVISVEAVPAEEEPRIMSSPAVSPRSTQGVPIAGQDDCNRMPESNSKGSGVASAGENTPTRVSVTPEPSDVVITSHDEGEALKGRNSQTSLLATMAEEPDENFASRNQQNSPEKINPLPASPQASKNLPKRPCQPRKRKASECSVVSEASDASLSKHAEPSDEKMCDVETDELLREQTSSCEFGSPTGSTKALRRSPRQSESPAVKPKHCSARKSPRKRVIDVEAAVAPVSASRVQSEERELVPSTESTKYSGSPQVRGQPSGSPCRITSQADSNLGQEHAAPSHSPVTGSTPVSKTASSGSDCLPRYRQANPGEDPSTKPADLFAAKPANVRSDSCRKSLEFPPKAVQIGIGVENSPGSNRASDSNKTARSTHLKSSPIQSKLGDTPKFYGPTFSSQFRSPRKGSGSFKAQAFESFADFARSQKQIADASTPRPEAFGLYRGTSSSKGPIYVDTDCRARSSSVSFIPDLVFGQLCWSFQLLSIQRSDNVCLLKQSSKPERSQYTGLSQQTGFSNYANHRSFGDLHSISKFNTYRDSPLPRGIKEEQEDDVVPPHMFSGHVLADQHRSRAFNADVDKCCMFPSSKNMSKSHANCTRSSVNDERNYFLSAKRHFKGEDRPSGCRSCCSCGPRSLYDNTGLLTVHRQADRYVPPETVGSSHSWSRCRDACVSSVNLKGRENCDMPNSTSAVHSPADQSVSTIDLTKSKFDPVARESGFNAEATQMTSPATFPGRTSPTSKRGDELRCGTSRGEQPSCKKPSLPSCISPARLSDTGGASLAGQTDPEVEPVVVSDLHDSPRGEEQCSSSEKNHDTSEEHRFSSHLSGGRRCEEFVTFAGRQDESSEEKSSAGSRHLKTGVPAEASGCGSPIKQSPAVSPRLEIVGKAEVRSTGPRSTKTTRTPVKINQSATVNHSTPLKPKRPPSECSSASALEATFDPEPCKPHPPKQSPSPSKTRASKSNGSTSPDNNSSDVSGSANCGMLSFEDPEPKIVPENVFVTPKTPKQKTCSATNGSAKKPLPPRTVRTRSGLANLVSGSKPFADSDDGSVSGENSNQNSSTAQDSLQAAVLKKEPSVPKLTRSSTRLKSTKKSRNAVTPENSEPIIAEMPPPVAGTSEKPVTFDPLSSSPARNGECSCNQSSVICVCQVERIMMETAHVKLLLPFPSSPVPSKVRKPLPENSKSKSTRPIAQETIPASIPQASSKSKPARGVKRKLSDSKSVPCKKKSVQPKSAEFVEESDSSESECDIDPEANTGEKILGKNSEDGEVARQSATATVRGKTEDESPEELLPVNGTFEGPGRSSVADPSSDEDISAGNKSIPYMPEGNHALLAAKRSGTSSDDIHPVGTAMGHLKKSGVGSASVKCEYYPTRRVLDKPHAPKVDPSSSQRNELNHLASFFQRSASSLMSSRVDEIEEAESNGSGSDSDSQMCIDEPNSRRSTAVETETPTCSTELGKNESRAQPLSYWTETANDQPLTAESSEPAVCAMPNFYRANDDPAVETLTSAPQVPSADEEETIADPPEAAAPNFYKPAVDSPTESVALEANPPPAVGRFLAMKPGAEAVPHTPDEVIPCSLNIMAFASHYKLPEEPKPRVPVFIKNSTKLKISNCLTEYLKGDFTPARLEKTLATIKNVNPHHVAMILSSLVGNIPAEEPSGNAPYKALHDLAPKAKRLLVLVVKLAVGRLEYFDAVLSKLEHSMLPVGKESSELIHVPVAQWYLNLTVFYVNLCRSQGFGLRCQSFVYDCLYGRHISSFLVVYLILSVFPWVLPKAHSEPVGPLCYTIAYLIVKQGIFGNCRQSLLSTYKVLALRKKLATHYGYRFSPDITRDHVIVDLVSNIKSKGSDVAIVLICKSQGFKWTQMVANKFFFPVLNNWISDEEKDEALVVVVTQILGKISRGFAGSLGTGFVSTSLKYMDLLLRVKSSLLIVDAVMESLVHFSRLDINGVAKIISSWTPSDYRVTPSAVKSVQKILKVRVGSFWDTWTPKS